IANWLRSSDTPVIVIANKAEGKAGEHGVIEAYGLGLGDPVPLSAEHGEGIVDLFESLLPHLESEGPDSEIEADGEEEEEELGPLKVAIVGRPKAGKSTLINRILGEQRMITGPEAEITRDSIAIDWDWKAPDGTVRPI